MIPLALLPPPLLLPASSSLLAQAAMDTAMATAPNAAANRVMRIITLLEFCTFPDGPKVVRGVNA
jgi:hypothetical protein